MIDFRVFFPVELERKRLTINIFLYVRELSCTYLTDFIQTNQTILVVIC